MFNFIQYYLTNLLINFFNIFIFLIIINYILLNINSKKKLQQAFSLIIYFIFNIIFLTLNILIIFLINKINLLQTNFTLLTDFSKIIQITYLNKFLPQNFNFIFDNISIGFIYLTLFITFLCCNITIFLNKSLKNKNINIFYILNLFLILCFITTDFLTFFFSFESTLIPLITLLFLFGTRSKKSIAS
jgi:NADH:ubiquinone oxidoreductase subunit 4 (subunit M)